MSNSSIVIQILTLVGKLCCGSSKSDLGHQQQQQPDYYNNTSANYPPLQQPQPSYYPQQPQSQAAYGYPPPSPHSPISSPIGAYHPQNSDQINASNSTYTALRAQANKEGDLMRSTLDQSQNAFQRGDKQQAHQLSVQGHAHQEKMQQLNEQASQFIFDLNNRDSPQDTVDLHGLYVKEAMAKTELAIQDAKRRNVTDLRVIVGKGNHSPHHVAKIKPAITELMRKEHLTASLEPGNSGVLVVHLNGQSRGISDSGWTEQMERNTESEGCSIQ